MFAVQQRRRWAQLGDPQAVPALIQALGDSGCDVRRAAAEALGANSATPKPCPRSACGRTQAKTPHATRCRRSDTLCLICHKRLRRLPRKARGAY
jgi:HEAT repeat protein